MKFKVWIAQNTKVCALSLKFKVWSLGFTLHKTQRCVLERGLLPHLSVLAAPYTRGHTRVFFLIVRTSSLSLLSQAKQNELLKWMKQTFVWKSWPKFKQWHRVSCLLRSHLHRLFYSFIKVFLGLLSDNLFIDCISLHMYTWIQNNYKLII